MVSLIRNAVSQSANSKQTMGLLIPNKVDYAVPTSQMFSIILFLILYSLFFKASYLHPHCAVLQKETVCFMKCK